MRVAIWGAAGTVGRWTLAAARARGWPVTLVGRTEAKLRALAPAGGDVEVRAADVAAADGCARAAAGVDAIVYTLGLPYTKRAFAAYPAMMRLAIAAARSARVRKLLLVTNVYPYGRPLTRPVDEEHPRNPASVKGRFRKQQEDLLLEAHGAELATASLRVPDFYGPYAELSTSSLIFTAAVAGKTANVLGPVDTPHEWAFTPDVGEIAVRLLERDDAFGRPYNFAGSGVVSVRELAAKVFRAAGHEPKLRAVGPRLQRALGLVVPLMRELAELSYLHTDPVLLDDRRLQLLLGDLPRTPYDEGIARTLAHLRAP